MLSGVFFAAAHLPAGFRFAVVFNPVFYLVDGFRQGFVRFAETDATAGLAVVVGLNIALFWICRRLFASGRGLNTNESMKPASYLNSSSPGLTHCCPV